MDLSPIAEEYLKAISTLETEHARPIRTVEIADEIGVTSASVSSMIDTLDERGLLEHTPYKGVELTGDGEEIVTTLVRKHRLLETFLTDHLDYRWTDVHEEADRLEHHVSDEFATRLATFLDDPTTDPHGDPIPDTALTVSEESVQTPLTEYEAGETVVVAQVPDRDHDVREYLFEHGLEPGTELYLEAVTAVGILEVVPDDADDSVSIPTKIARHVSARATSR
ncbi:metal-dependent transcriptional regulator [Natronorubrum sulfidifaciens]|uniref:Iron (Metal) dependent repressor, DtxR family protein n=1 Tax=Natronorubrum sulfidifaciens JCM 14089 TaxID=1230460 RepID=L9WCZ6_9EURY|nr:metal-dependent transcriptional regulator [Natronorubrum sulfidifaciens]ELY47365.1 iron (metal) dependent repressor, DtxR family protein [Natronorubrum sulfidifaciens JCM 14089]